MRSSYWIPAILFSLFVVAGSAAAETFQGNPSNYLSIVSTLQPGDTLELAAGDYTGRLNLRLHGEPDAWITIKGPESGAPARFLGDPGAGNNTIEIREGSYLALENLTIDGQSISGIFAISAASGPTHHIRVEGCTIVGHDSHQQTVGISTKTPTWGWIIRGNKIVGAGTGIYCGSSNGTNPFVGGLIENNLFLDSHGYNMEIKHQTSRPAVEGMPTTPQRTIIRHNVFLKTNTLPSESGPRPNLLVGHFPATGNGSEDFYEVYGNFFYHNHVEALMQAEGRVVIHDNVFVDTTHSALYLADHNLTLDIAYVYNNTFYSVERGIRFGDPARVDHFVVGNAIFGNNGLVGPITNESDNVFDATANAGDYVANPSIVLGAMDFYPLAGSALEGSALDLSGFTGHADYDLDFNGNSKGGFTFRGAYAGSGANPGWQLTDDFKDAVSGGPGDTDPPTGTVTVAGGAATTEDLLVDLTLDAQDGGSGMGSGALMRFSNDGATWSPAESYATVKTGWDLSAYGGDAAAGTKTVHAQFRDVAGNWSAAAIAATIEYAPQTGGTGGGGTGGGGCAVVPGGGSPFDFFATILFAVPLFVWRRRRFA